MRHAKAASNPATLFVYLPARRPRAPRDIGNDSQRTKHSAAIRPFSAFGRRRQPVGTATISIRPA